MNGRWTLHLLAIATLSMTAAACDPGMDSESPTLETSDSRHHPPRNQCKVTDCVVGLEPDLENGTIAESICGCTETDFWDLEADCDAQGGIVVADGSCGDSTPSCDATTLNCVIPAPSTPEVVARSWPASASAATRLSSGSSSESASSSAAPSRPSSPMATRRPARPEHHHPRTCPLKPRGRSRAMHLARSSERPSRATGAVAFCS